MKKSRRASIFARILFVFLGLLLGLFIAELLLRKFSYVSLNLAWDCYRPDLKMYMTYKPYSTCPYRRFKEYDNIPRINNVGLRSDTNTTLEKPVGVKRVLILGDSLVAAHEFEEKETFVKLLENRFRDQGEYVEVLNGGIRGYSPFLTYFYLKFRAIQFDPDLVILLINTADVVNDKRYRDYGKIDPNTGEIVSVFPNWTFYFNRLEVTKSVSIAPIARSRTLCDYLSPGFWWRQFNSLRTIGLIRKNIRGLINRTLGFHFLLQEFRLGDWRTDDLAVERETMVRDDYETLVGETKDNIDKIASLLRTRSIPFYLVLTPMGHEVGLTEWNFGRVGWGAEQNRIYPTKSLDDIGAWANEKEIKVVNLKPYLTKPGGPYFLPKDGHFTPLGHERVAEGLWDNLNEGNRIEW
jgi:lysophospholipase L1-like esterase